MLTQDAFDALAAQGFNRIPVAREVLSDLDTPLSVYLKLADAPYAYLFESVEGGENWGRYSIIGLPRTGNRTFGRSDFIRVPIPAASTTATASSML